MGEAILVTGWDVIGDLHSCVDEFWELLANLGYHQIYPTGEYYHPEGRQVVLLGDLTDRGWYPVLTLITAMNLVKSGVGHCILGNHCWKLLRYLRDDLAGVPIRVKVGKDLAKTIAAIDAHNAVYEGFKQELYEFLCSLPYKMETDDLILVHGAYKDAKPKVQKDIAIYGETDGTTGADGYPTRTYRWRDSYMGKKWIIFGHDIFPEPNIYICASDACIIGIDTGVCYGGKLTAFRWPEQEFLNVPARKVYAERKTSPSTPPNI